MTNLPRHTTWETMTYSYTIFDYINIMFLLIPIIIIGIVLMMNISDILDSDLNLLGRLKQSHEENPRAPTTLDLNYTKMTGADGNDYLFVFDRLDHRGSNMFYPCTYGNRNRGYVRCSHGGFMGYRKPVDLNTNNESFVVGTLARFHSLQSSGAHVLSNGLPIGTQRSGKSILLSVKEIRW